MCISMYAIHARYMYQNDTYHNTSRYIARHSPSSEKPLGLAQLFLTATADSSLDENGISNRKIQKESTLFGQKLCFSGGKADFCGGLWSFDAHCGTFATAVVSEA